MSATVAVNAAMVWLGWLGFFGWLGFAGAGRATPERPDAAVVLFERGVRQPLAPGDPAARELVALCETQLQTASEILRLAVGPSLLRDLRDREWVVEITYSTTRTWPSPFPNRPPLRIRRLLIPLSGDLAGSMTTIFLGDAEYVAGPYRNHRGTRELEILAARLDSTKR